MADLSQLATDLENYFSKNSVEIKKSISKHIAYNMKNAANAVADDFYSRQPILYNRSYTLYKSIRASKQSYTYNSATLSMSARGMRHIYGFGNADVIKGSQKTAYALKRRRMTSGLNGPVSNAGHYLYTITIKNVFDLMWNQGIRGLPKSGRSGWVNRHYMEYHPDLSIYGQRYSANTPDELMNKYVRTIGRGNNKEVQEYVGNVIVRYINNFGR